MPLLSAELAKDACQSVKPVCIVLQSQKLGSDQRYLSISAFLWQKPADRHQPQPQVGAEGQQAPTQDGTTQEACLPPAEASRQVLPGIAAHPVQVFVVAAASDASLALLTADLAGPRRQLGTGQRQQQWQEVAALRHHAYPVLCTVHCCLEVPSADLVGSGGNGSSSAASRRQHRHIICSGDTDGCVAVWDVTAAGGPLAAPAAGGAAAGASHAEPVEVQEVHPLLALEGVHQSGVNSVAAVAAGGLLCSACRYSTVSAMRSRFSVDMLLPCLIRRSQRSRAHTPALCAPRSLHTQAQAACCCSPVATTRRCASRCCTSASAPPAHMPAPAAAAAAPAP